MSRREPRFPKSTQKECPNPHKHCRLKVAGCVSTTAGGHLVTTGKPSSQGLFTGCCINDSRDLRTHMTAVWDGAERSSHSGSADMVGHRDKDCISVVLAHGLLKNHFM